MPSFEVSYRQSLTLYELRSRAQIPLEVTVYGSLSGLLGPIFLLSPIALLALRRPEGRQLLLAALVFSLTYFSNIAARFLIAPLPFVALAMTIALGSMPVLAVAMALVHALLSWPAIIPRYAHDDAWRLLKIPWKDALRLRSEPGYLNLHLVHYAADRMIEQRTRPGSTVFTFVPVPEAYTSRRIRVEYQSAENQVAGKMLRSAVAPEAAPTWRLRFAFPRIELQGVRLVQTATSATETWSIHELRIFDGTRELVRAPDWRLRAAPYPWTIQDAFDNSLATFWMCSELLRPNQFVQVDFHGTHGANRVVLEGAPNQWSARFRLEGRSADGRWQVLSTSPAADEAPMSLGLRRAIAGELKRRGIDYLLVFDQDQAATDLRLKTEVWGMKLVASSGDARLYELPDQAEGSAIR